mmetsp:Transcript_71841/g.203465  ORF Transcript_71841/g.203465 Transcript_71841/m.203465 type:complete len:260 (-) Transcript_71841:1453-2232(-)
MMTGLRTTVLLLGLLAPLSHGELSQSNHLSVLAGSVFSIDDYGAVATENSVEAATANAAALTAALEVAHSAGRGSVLVPSGSVYYTLPFSGSSHVGVSLIVDGVVKACNSNDCQDAWPCTKESHFDYLFEWDNGTDLTLAGHGTIDGQGYKWWWQFLLNKIPGDRKRPGLVYMTSGTGLNVANITLRNSPIMHMHFDNITGEQFSESERSRPEEKQPRLSPAPSHPRWTIPSIPHPYHPVPPPPCHVNHHTLPTSRPHA